MLWTEEIQLAVERAHQLAAERELWPGWRFDQVPLVLHGGGEAYLVGHPAPPQGYEPAGELAGRPVFHGPVLPEMAANTAAVVAGHLSALAMLPAGALPAVDRFARLLLHEAFHCHQQVALGTVRGVDRAAMALMARYPEGDATNNAMAIVENRLLGAALAGEAGALGSFLAMREHRQKRLARLGFHDLPAYEQVVEYTEGTPTYIEVRAGLPVADLIERLGTYNLAGKGAAYERFYWTGAAQALLLDQVDPGWQESLAEADGSLQRLLLAAVDQVPPVSAVVKATDFLAVLAREEAGERERLARIAALQAELADGPGVRVELHLPPSVPGVIWDPTSVLNVGDGVRLHPRLCGVRGEGGLRVDISRLCLEEVGPEGRRLTVRLPVPPAVVQRAGRLLLDAPGLVVDVAGAQVEQEARKRRGACGSGSRSEGRRSVARGRGSWRVGL